MATETPPKPIPPESIENPSQATGLGEVVDSRLSQTRRQLRSVDLAAGLLWLACAAIGWFLIVAIVDHWIFAEGLGSTGRWTMLLLFLFGGSIFSFFRIVRPLTQRVNPVYVAHRIEQTDTSAKNSLINFLLLRRSKETVAPSVFEAVTERAAGDIQRVAPEEAIDWGGVIRIAYLFTALVAIGAIYQVVSPKSPLASVARAVAPWSDRAAPTRVAFNDIRPGNVTTFYGKQIVVSAEVSGLDEEETPTLYYTTADGQTVGRPIPMRQPEGDYRYECTIPPEPEGIRQDLKYHLAAGDSRSPVFQITAETPPTIAVETIRYDYPDYTREASKTVSGSPDIVAIEGTQVTIRAKSNREMRRAVIDLGCDHLHGIPMTVEERVATGSWTLRQEDDPKKVAEQHSYQLLFVDEQGNENPMPIRHTIRIIPDRAPSVRLIDPPGDAIELPEDGRLELTVAAEDSDFGLREVSLRVEREGRRLPLAPMLRTATTDPSPEKLFEGTIAIEPAQLGLKQGDEIEYWAEAKDVKTPIANVAQTERLRILIVPSGQKEEAKTEEGQPQEEKKEQDQQDQSQQEGQQGEQQDQGQQEGQQGEQQDQGQQEGQQGEQQDQGQQEGQQGEQQDQGQQEGQQGQQQDQGQQEGQQGEQQDQGQQEGQQGEQQDQGQQEDQQGEKQDQGQQEGQQGEQQDQGQQEGQQGEQQDQGQQEGQQGEQQDQGQQEGQQGQGQQGQQEGQGQQQQGQNGGDQKQPGGPKQQSDESNGKPDRTQGDAKNGQSKPDEPIDGEANPGDVFEEVLKRCENCDSGQPKDGAPTSEGKPDSASGSGDQQRPAEDPTKATPGQSTPKTDELGQPIGESSKEGGQTQDNGQDEGQEGTEGETVKPLDQDPNGTDQATGKEIGEETDQEIDQEKGTHVPDDRTEPSGNQTQGPGEGGTRLEGQPPTDAETEQPGNQPSEGPTRPHEGDSEKPVNQPSPEDLSEGTSDRQGQAPTELSRPDGKKPSDAEPGDTMAGGTGEGPDEMKTPQADRVGPDPFDKEAADRKTALALEYLKDQLAKEKPDAELLDSLGGWTRDDLERFVQRWESMRDAAKQVDRANQKAASRYEEALRSLGLPTGRTELKAGSESRRVEDVRQSRDSKPPASWQDRIDAYRRSIGAP